MSNANQTAIFAALVAAGKLTQAEVDAITESMKPQPKVSIKLSEKGAVSVYGLGRFPVTLYRSQWLKLRSRMDEISAFLDANKDALDAVDAKRAGQE